MICQQCRPDLFEQICGATPQLKRGIDLPAKKQTLPRFRHYLSAQTRHTVRVALLDRDRPRIGLHRVGR